MIKKQCIQKKVCSLTPEFHNSPNTKSIKQLLGGNTGNDLNLDLMSQKFHIDSKPPVTTRSLYQSC